MSAIAIESENDDPVVKALHWLTFGVGVHPVCDRLDDAGHAQQTPVDGLVKSTSRPLGDFHIFVAVAGPPQSASHIRPTVRETKMSESHAVDFETNSGRDPQTPPTVFTEQENDALSSFSAEYSAGLNGSGPVNKFHHAKGRDLAWTRAGLRDFFSYADPGIRNATGNRLDVHLVRANEAPEYGTGWHRHKLGFHVIYMVSGWARFMYEGKPTLVEASDFVNMPPGITHYLYDYSPDMCFLEIAMAGTPDGMIPEESVEPFCETPAPKPWPNGSSSDSGRRG